MTVIFALVGHLWNPYESDGAGKCPSESTFPDLWTEPLAKLGLVSGFGPNTCLLFSARSRARGIDPLVWTAGRVLGFPSVVSNCWDNRPDSSVNSPSHSTRWLLVFGALLMSQVVETPAGSCVPCSQSKRKMSSIAAAFLSILRRRNGRKHTKATLDILEALERGRLRPCGCRLINRK